MKYPHPKGSSTSRPPATGLHPTAGLPGNYALDFMAPGGTLVLASEAGRVARISGHNPIDGVVQGSVFGWSVYLECGVGFYYDTHLGAVFVHVGQHVVEGQPIGRVGHWPHDEGRSHTHRGFTAHAGKAASVKRIQQVRVGQKVKPVWAEL